METVGAFRVSADKIGTAKTEKKIPTTKDQLGKKTMTAGLCNFLPATTVNKEMIAKLEKS